jgi:hypothetical protein
MCFFEMVERGAQYMGLGSGSDGSRSREWPPRASDRDSSGDE